MQHIISNIDHDLLIVFRLKSLTSWSAYLAPRDCWHLYPSHCCRHRIVRQRTRHCIGALECCWVNEGSKNGLLTWTYLIWRRSTRQCWIIAQSWIVQADSSCTHRSSPTDSASTREPALFFSTLRRHFEIFLKKSLFSVTDYVTGSCAKNVFAITQIQTAHTRYRQQSSYFCTVPQNGSNPVLTGDDFP